MNPGACEVNVGDASTALAAPASANVPFTPTLPGIAPATSVSAVHPARLSPSKRAIIATGLPHEVRWVRTVASCGAWLVVLVGMAVAMPGAPAAELEGKALVEALQDGGYNIYFRHARRTGASTTVSRLRATGPVATRRR